MDDYTIVVIGLIVTSPSPSSPPPHHHHPNPCSLRSLSVRSPVNFWNKVYSYAISRIPVRQHSFVLEQSSYE